jgi:hypothetical protein
VAATLQEILLTPETQPKVVTDCKLVIDQEVSEKSGVSGTAVKLAYKTATSFAPGYFHNTVEDLLPQLADQLEPYWADFSASGGAGFGDYLAKRGPEVCESLLAVTDSMARDSGRAAVVKAYGLVRGSAGKNIEPALPALGALVQKYAG